MVTGVNFIRIKFETIRKEILTIFPSASLNTWDLTPDSIHQLAATQGIDLDWRGIPNWTDFEAGRIDYDENQFLNFAFYKHTPLGQMYVVTDNCFKTREAYQIKSNDLMPFVKELEQLSNESPFVQPADYLFINPDQKLVTIIHHEGQVTQYKRWI